jgi:AcrR family transcriptional regulator
MGRKKQDPSTSAKRVLILKAAGEMFVKHGFSAVSMDAIAEAVPVSKRTLYNHFSDKKELFTAVMGKRCQQVFEMLEENLHEEREVKLMLSEVGRRFLEIVLDAEALDMYRTLITEAQKFPELGKLFYESGPSRTQGMLAQYLGKLHEKKILQVPRPEKAAVVFFSMMLNRVQMQCLLGVKQHVTPEERADIIHYAVEVFTRGHGLKE